jgi:hypothetical protein
MSNKTMLCAGVLAVSSLVAAEPDLAADAKAPPQEATKRQSKRGRIRTTKGLTVETWKRSCPVMRRERSRLRDNLKF